MELTSSFTQFELKEEPEEINIQGIEEFKIVGCNIEFNETLISTANCIEDMMVSKINELIKAVKQLDRKINNRE